MKNYLATTPIENTPLGVLPEIEREIFINSLVFTRRGLASFDYSVFSYGPTATEVYNILALFGSQSTTPFLPGLTIASEADNSIMRVAEFMQLNAQLLDHQCRWNAPIQQFSCLFTPLKSCFPTVCF